MTEQQEKLVIQYLMAKDEQARYGRKAQDAYNRAEKIREELRKSVDTSSKPGSESLDS